MFRILNYTTKKIFSDNFIWAFPDKYLIEKSIQIFYYINKIIEKLTICGFFVRGAITYGDICLKKDFIIGKGLIDVVELSDHIANYPRVIVSKEALNFFENFKDSFRKLFSLDCDGFWFLDFLKFSSMHIFTPYYGTSDFVSILERVSSLINENIIKYRNNIKVLEKYYWMGRYCNFYLRKENINQYIIRECNDYGLLKFLNG